ncbi:MAG: methyltransferase [Anaerolineae bacterium]
MKANSIWVSTDLVLANTQYGEDERILIMSGDSPDLIEAIAGIASAVDVYDLQYNTLTRLKQYVRKDNVQFFDTVYPQGEAHYDSAIVFVPKGREFGRALIWSAMSVLKDGSELVIVGPNKGGAKTLIKDAEEAFGNCQVLDYKRSHRVAVTQKKQSDYTYPAGWGDLPTDLHYLTLETAIGTLEVATQPGIFSWQELDDGTAYLLENLDLRDAQTVLDLGCGYGVIGALIAPHVEQVTLSDNNLLAVRCARATIERNGIGNASVVASDIYSALPDARFDLIVSNPPFHRGFEVKTNITQKMIERAPDHLNSGGRMVLVANSFLKYEDVMAETFRSDTIRSRDEKFKVMEGTI